MYRNRKNFAITYVRLVQFYKRHVNSNLQLQMYVQIKYQTVLQVGAYIGSAGWHCSLGGCRCSHLLLLRLSTSTND